MNEERLSPKRWLALFCIFLMHVAAMGSITQTTGFSNIIIGQWGVDDVMFAQIATVGFLTGAIFSIPMGMLADKFGVTKIMGIGFVVLLIGSICRIFADSLVPLYASLFVMGFGLAGLNANSVKFLRPWFKIERLTTAMGIYVCGAGVGSTLGLMTVGMFESMQAAFIGASVFIAVSVVIWFAFARIPRDASMLKDDYSAAAVKECLTNRPLMLTSLAMVFAMCIQVPFMSFTAAGFISKGIDPAQAAQWASLCNMVGIPSNFIWCYVADRVGRIKPVLTACVLLSAILIAVGWTLSMDMTTLVIIIIGCFLGFASAALIKSCVGLIPTIKPDRMGTAGGIQTFFQNLGAFIIPSFIMAPIAAGNYTVLFYLVAVCAALCVVTFFFVPELGSKVRGSVSAETKH